MMTGPDIEPTLETSISTLESTRGWIDETQDPHIPIRGRLITLLGSRPGEVLALGDGPYVIGRDVTAQLRFDNHEVSRRHAMIERGANNGFVLRDLGSRNGTRVNGEMISARQLESGDRINIGPSELLMFTFVHALDEKLHESQKMEAIGQLAGGVAHDFNNLLTVVLASIGFLRGASKDELSTAEAHAALADAEAASMRGLELTRQLLGLARRGKYEASTIDVGVLLKEVARMVRRTFDPSISIETRNVPHLAVTGDRTQLHQVLMNLCINARDAMPCGGRLVLDARFVDARDGRPRVVISVEDNGGGMDEQTRRRAFEPFFTTKPVGSGTGLGLATVYGIVQNHGGGVDIDSEPGRGTTIRVSLPATYEVIPSRAPTPTGAGMKRSGEGSLVLVADDEELVRRGMSRVLEKNGFRVAHARDGVEAVDVFRKRRLEIGAVVLDLGMPNMSGEDAFVAMRRIDPSSKVLIVSGYTDETRVQRMLSEGAVGFLQKPYTMRAFLETVARIVS